MALNCEFGKRRKPTRAFIYDFTEVIPTKNKTRSLTGLEIVAHDTEGFKLWPVPKTVPSCSRVLGFEHVLIVLDYSVERCKSGRQIK